MEKNNYNAFNAQRTQMYNIPKSLTEKEKQWKENRQYMWLGNYTGE